MDVQSAAITLGTNNDSFSVASLVASSVTLGSSNVTVTVGA